MDGCEPTKEPSERLRNLVEEENRGHLVGAVDGTDRHKFSQQRRDMDPNWTLARHTDCIASRSPTRRRLCRSIGGYECGWRCQARTQAG